jgi:hypothetical protein
MHSDNGQPERDTTPTVTKDAPRQRSLRGCAYMKEKGTNRVLSVATAVVFLLSINACGTTFHQNPQLSALQTGCGGSACFADVSDHVALLSANTYETRAEDYFARCGEQARMVHHEIQNCRAVTVITVPFDHADTTTEQHTPSPELSDFDNR